MTVTLPASMTEALLGVYRKPPMELVRGSGVELYDSDGKAYLDFVAGIAVNALGYGDAGLEQAMRQAMDGSLIHTSNLYRTLPGERLAERLVELSFAQRVFSPPRTAPATGISASIPMEMHSIAPISRSRRGTAKSPRRTKRSP